MIYKVFCLNGKAEILGLEAGKIGFSGQLPCWLWNLGMDVPKYQDETLIALARKCLASPCLRMCVRFKAHQMVLRDLVFPRSLIT